MRGGEEEMQYDTSLSRILFSTFVCRVLVPRKSGLFFLAPLSIAPYLPTYLSSRKRYSETKN